MSTLRIFDASQYIASGVGPAIVKRGVFQSSGVYMARELRVAGVNVLLNAVIEFIDQKDTTLAFAFDDKPTFKRRLYRETFGDTATGYKGNRQKRDPHFTQQRKLAREVLEACNINNFLVKDFEADDIIATLVEKYRDDFDRIIIHTRDSDLFYLVDEKVTIEKVNNVGKNVTRDNWETTVLRDKILPYGTLLLNKLIVGEPGDNIPAIPTVKAQMLLNALDANPIVQEVLADTDFLHRWVNKIVGDDKRVMGTLELLIPVILDYDEVELHDEPCKVNMLRDFCIEFQNKYFKNNVPTQGNPDVEEVIERNIDEYLESIR